MVDHNLLLAKLKYYKFSENALMWCKNYFSNREFRVSMTSSSIKLDSPSFQLVRGVPQGSILGPLFFLLYVADLPADLKHCDFHSYADDTQLLASCFPSEVSSVVNNIIYFD